MHGIFLPVITPFIEGSIDFESYRSLIRHYLGIGIQGIIPLGTTGEVSTIESDEYTAILETTLEATDGRLPVITGISGNATAKMTKLINRLNHLSVDGYLVTAPYYNLPSQEGIYQHFKVLAKSTDKPVYIYNIPYRTGRNMENDTILRLAQIPNIAGIKDSCGNTGQSIELISKAREDFSVMTGEDVFYFANLCHGGAGGVLAAAHVDTEKYLRVYELIQANDVLGARAVWKELSVHIPLFFKEPNPAPIKYLLYKKGLIRSPEVRGPLSGISDGLKERLNLLV
ncbi:MAG: 4-hydroxy-tetrahydrodipicolinate synthase [Spirochaetales bacterium]|nr:4-hydroxy-tetrahydrodipicolinate synthase [Spirochaetales bacterium]